MQSARSKFALLAAAALTLAVLALVALRWGANSSAADVTAAAPVGTGPLPLDDVEVRELRPLPAASESTINEAPRRAVENSTIPNDSFATVVLRGTIESDRGDLQLAHIRLWASWREFSDPRVYQDIGEEKFDSHGASGAPPYVDLHAQPDGEFQVDVTKLVRDPDRKGIARTLLIEVDHPRLLSVLERVAVPSEERVRSESRIELTTTVQMSRSMVRLNGEAWTIDGVPATIHVAPIRSAGESPDDLGNSVATVNKERGFALDVAGPADYAIVAVADGYRPCSLRVSIVPGDDVTLPPLVLDHGHTISGRVKLGPRTSFAGATVAGQPAGKYERVQIAGKSLACFDDGFEWASRSARVDASGYYELSELGPRAYSVSTSGVQGAYLGNTKSHEFVAPSAGADLTLGAVCEVHVTFHGPGQPTRTRFGVRQQFTNGGGGFGSQETAADGRVTLFIEPGTTATLEVGDRAFPVPACSAGGVLEMRVDL